MTFATALGRLSRMAAMLALFAPGTLSAEEVTTFKDTSRIAAIGGAITEIVFALGEEGKLVARDSTSVYPEAAFKLPDVGYMRALSPEGVLSVNPTGILALEGSGPKEAIDVLKKASVPFVTVPERFDEAGLVDRILFVGKAIGAEEKAARLAASVKADVETAEKLTAGVKDKQRVLFILSLQDGRILASGSGTAADGIIRMAGAVNAVEGFQGYKQLADEALVAARPDLVLVMERGPGHGLTAETVFAVPVLAETPAGKARRLIRMDGAYLLGFGPRTAAAIRDLAVAIYGETVAN